MNRRRNISVESIMVILLLIILAVSISVLIFEGSLTYRKILTNKNNEENIRIALSYVNMRVKQNDLSNYITVDEDAFEGSDVLTIDHHDAEEGLMSYIYWKDGYLWECYTDGPLDHNLSSEIIPLAGIDFEMSDEGQYITTTVMAMNNQDEIQLTQLTTLRTD